MTLPPPTAVEAAPASDTLQPTVAAAPLAVDAPMLLLLLTVVSDERPEASEAAWCPFIDDDVVVCAADTVLPDAEDMVATPDVLRLADDCATGSRDDDDDDDEIVSEAAIDDAVDVAARAAEVVVEPPLLMLAVDEAIDSSPLDAPATEPPAAADDDDDDVGVVDGAAEDELVTAPVTGINLTA